jgi:hypothetical protein
MLKFIDKEFLIIEAIKKNGNCEVYSLPFSMNPLLLYSLQLFIELEIY